MVSYRGEAAIKDLMFGRSIVSFEKDSKGRADYGILTLSDGTVLTVNVNYGSCCDAGQYNFEDISAVENVITDVKVVKESTKDILKDTRYTVFVYAAGVSKNKKGKKEKLFSIVGTDGSGYYGTGFSINVGEIKPFTPAEYDTSGERY